MKKTIESDFSKDEFEVIERHAGTSKQYLNSKLLAALLDAYMNIGNTYVSQLPLELTLIEQLQNKD
jgi:hypothetical protein